MATDLMFNLAGFKTRIVRLSSNPDSVPNGNHISVEYYSKTQGKWIMLEAMINYIPELNKKGLSVFEIFQDENAMEMLQGSCGNACNPKTVLNLTFPNPTYRSSLEIYWASSGGAVANGEDYHKQFSNSN